MKAFVQRIFKRVCDSDISKEVRAVAVRSFAARGARLQVEALKEDLVRTKIAIKMEM